MQFRDLDDSWTLFLDRDGVINERLVGDYIANVDQFKFTRGACEAIYNCTNVFGRIIIVTNQQGIGKGMMGHYDLSKIHKFMISEIENAHGKIDQVYYCPHLSMDNSYYRKPNPGMAMLAKEEFPEIDFKRSIMVGDSDSDIRFGNLLGMFTILIDGKVDENHMEEPDMRFSSLFEFGKKIKKSK